MTVSVVIPMFRTSASLTELLRRLAASLPEGAEVVLVDDACPEESWRVAADVQAPTLKISVVRLTRNVGQVAAVQVGLSRASGDIIAVIDADLQDPPESLPALLAELGTSTRFDVVCSVRAGNYESWSRRVTAHLYRRVASTLSRGRIPLDAGMFLVARRQVVEDMLKFDDPFVPIVPGLARAGATMKGLKVHRQPRPIGRSSYSFRGRLALAARGLTTLTPLHRLLARVDRARWRRLDCHVVTVR